jgi:hypothetical protein
MVRTGADRAGQRSIRGNYSRKWAELGTAYFTGVQSFAGGKATVTAVLSDGAHQREQQIPQPSGLGMTA